MADTPQWIADYVAQCKDALGLHEWEIEATVHRVVTAEDPEARAKVQCRYKTAELEFRADFEPDDKGHALVLHEMYHVLHASSTLAIERIIELVPKELRRHAHNLWEDGNERTTERFAKAMVKLIPPKGESSGEVSQ